MKVKEFINNLKGYDDETELKFCYMDESSNYYELDLYNIEIDDSQNNIEVEIDLNNFVKEYEDEYDDMIKSILNNLNDTMNRFIKRWS